MIRNKIALPLIGLLALAGCGGGGSDAPVRAFSKGPIQAACEDAGRRAASPSLCGCVQAVANRTLSRGDRRRAAVFFGNPHRAQVTRQSDDRGDEAFWKRYKAFVSASERSCR